MIPRLNQLEAADTPYEVIAQSTDRAGNVSTSTSRYEVFVTEPVDDSADLRPTDITLTSDTDEGVSSADAITNRVVPTFRVSLNSGTAAGDTVEIYQGTTLIVSRELDSADITTGHIDLAPWKPLSNNATYVGNNGVFAQVVSGDTTSPARDMPALVIDTSAPSNPGNPQLVGENSPISRGNGFSVYGSMNTSQGVAFAEIYADGRLLGTTALSERGRWQFTVPNTVAPLADGNHEITVVAVDTAGNRSNASGALSLTVDTSVTAPSDIRLRGDSDSGIAGDRLTNVTKPWFQGRGEPGSELILFADRDGDGRFDPTEEIELYSGNVDNDGTFNVRILHDLPEGRHVLRFIQVDEAGNYSAPSAPIALTIDTSVASLEMVRIAPSTAADDSGLYPDDGIYDTLRPTLRAYLPDQVAEGDRLEVYYRHPASDAPRASNLVDNPLLTQIDIERGYVDVTPAEDMRDRRTFNGTSIKFGSWQYAFFGRIVDQAGNASSIRDPGAAEPYAYVDVEGPQAASGLGLMDQDDTGVASDDNITALQTGFTLTTGRLGTWVTKVDFYANGALLGTAAPNDNRYAKFTYDGPELDAGVYWITAVTHRSSGVPTAPTEQFELIIDPTEKSPVPQFGKLQLRAGEDTGLSQNDGITKSGRVYIEGVLTPGQTVMVFNDLDGDGQYTVGERVGTATSDATTGAFSVGLTLNTGTNVLRAVTVPSSDLADPVASEPFTVIRRGIPASEPISISLLASSDTTVFNAEDGISGGSFLTSESRPELRLTLPGEMQAGDLVQLFNGNTKIYSLLADEEAIAAGFMDVRLPAGGELADGSHNLSMKVADAAGNNSRKSPSIKVTVDTVG
ncbi:MAG: hypothetical protein FKY71_13505, partial [Spiribacter salinus]